MDITRVPPLSGDERDGLKALTAHVLPDNPSARGLSAAQIKAALVRAFVGEDANNVAGLIDRVIEDMNASLGEVEGGLEAVPRMHALVDGFAAASAALVPAPAVASAVKRKAHKTGILYNYHFFRLGGGCGCPSALRCTT